MLDYSTRSKKLRFGVAFLLLAGTNLFAQTPGMIFENQGISVLDPNGDGYISKLSTGFVGNDESDSEIPYIPIVFPAAEPNSDLGPGPDCGFTDFVQQAIGVQDAGQQYFDLTGNNWLFRIRLGGSSPNSKSYSLMIDTDMKFGNSGPNADPNYVVGNPGFEIELVLGTNFGVYVYDVNGTTNSVLKRTYSVTTHHQKAIALSAECNTPDYFYDFFVPFADLTTDFGISASTPVRMVLLDNMAANTSSIAKPTSMSDIGGIDDAAYGGNLDLAFGAIINNYTPTCSTCPPGLDRTVCPTINGPIANGATSVSITTAEAVGTIIKVFNGATQIGTATTTTSPQTISITVSPAVTTGSTIYATATAPGKGASINNCDAELVVSCTGTVNAPIFTQVRTGSKEIEFKVDAPVGATVGLFVSSTNVLAVGDKAALTNNPLTITPYDPNLLRVIGQNSGSNTLVNGSYYLKTTYNGCESTFTYFCHGLSASTTPSVLTNPITPSTSQISGTGTSASSTILIYKNGVQIASGTTAATSPYTFSINVSGLALCDQISASQVSAGACVSVPTAAVSVTQSAATPVINQVPCISGSLASVTGTTTEAYGSATVKLYSYSAPSTYSPITGTSAIASNGVWTFTPVSAIAANTTIVATITDASNCKTESSYSAAITLAAAPPITVATTINSPVYEDAVSVSGAGVNGQWVQLYVDDAIPYKNVSGTLTAIGRVQVAGGIWSVTVDANSIYAGAVLRVSVTSASTGGCESALSASSVTVQCVAPALPTYVGGSKSYCFGTPGSVTLSNTESGVIYQLVNGAGVAVGPSAAGNGGSIVLYTYALSANLTGVYVKLFNLLSSGCVVTTSTKIDFDTQSPSPDITLTNTNATVVKGATSTIFAYTATANGPTHYSVDFSLAAKNQGFVNVSSTALPSSPITITVPAGAAVGSYSAVLNITNATACGTTKNITITVYTAASAPIVSVHPVDKTICSGSGTTFSVSATGTPTAYQWQVSTDGGYSWSSVSGAVYSGAGTATLSISNVAGLSGNKYNCIVTNANGSVTSNYGSLTVQSNPSIATDPSGQTVCSGNTASFSVAALNATTLKWQVDNGGGYVDVADGGIYNGATTSTLSISNSTGLTGYKYRAVATNSCNSATSAGATLTVNSCTTPTVSLSAGAASINENGGSTSLTATLSSVVASDVTVTLGYSGSTSGSDYSAGTSIVIPAGQLSASITLSSTNDVVYEGNETVIAEITAVANADENGNQSVTVTINDDESIPAISISDEAEVEGSDITFSVTLSNASTQTISVSYATTDGTALAGLDYTAGSGLLTFTPGTTSQSITISTTADKLYEGNEAFSVALSGASNATIFDGNAVSTILDNDAKPVTVADSYTVLEGGTLNVNTDTGLLANDTDADADALTAVLVAAPAYSTLTLYSNGSFTYVQNGGDSANDSFTYKSNDGVNDGNTVTVSLTITPVNDEPSFTKGADQTVNEDAGVQTVANWATSLNKGAANESSQALTFTVTNDNNSLFSAQPAISSATGILTYTLAANANGSATVSVVLTDDGGTANGGDDTYTTQTFTITVNSVNDEPSFTKGANQSANEDAGSQVVANWATNINKGAANESGQTLTFTVTNDNNALFSVQPTIDAITGTLSYTTAANANGSSTVSIVLKDNGGTANGGDDTYATQTFTITVAAVNDAPVAVADSYSVNEGATLNVPLAGVLTNDTDVEGNSLSPIKVTDPSHGALTLNANGSFTYVHDGSETISDSFTYKVNDGSVDGNTVTVTLTITPVNDTPVAVADGYSLNEGDVLTISAPGLLSNDTDTDGNTLTATKVTNPTNGTVTVNTNGSFTYTHNGGETTSDNFTYKINDGIIDGNTVTVSLSIVPVNDAPVAVADGYNVNEGGVLNVSAAGVLSNDTDADGNPITASGVSNPLHGTLVLDTDGSFTYTHDGSETTSDSFTYKVNDGTVDGNTVTVSLTINPVNDNPVAVADNYNVAMGATITINAASGLLINDTDAENNSLTAVLVTNPTHGTLTLNASGSFTYTHDNSVTYTDAFTYRVNDGNANSNIVTVTLNITGVNNLPVSNNDGFSLNEGATITQSAANGVLKNDTDADSDPLTANLVSNVSHGTLTFNTDGSFTYTHDGSETTSDSFTYRTNDGKQNGNLATVTFTISGVNDAPVTVADSYSVNEGATLIVPASGVLTNDTDIEGNALTAVLVSGPSNGTLTLNTDGSFTYTHNGGETTSDSFTYKANDGTVGGNTVTVSITVTAVNDAPVAVADSYTVGEGGTLTVNIAAGLLANDSDVDGDVLNTIKVTNPVHGTLVLSNDGSFTYTHNGGETTSDSFTYKVNDGTVDGNTVTVSLAITPENDAPAAVADSYNVNEGGTLTETAANGVLKNDVDADGNPLSAILVSGTTNGALTLHADGSFTYTHNGGETTSDSFTYKVNDGSVDGNTVTVTLSVTAMNDAPVAVADAYSVAEGGTLTVDAPTGLLNNDTDAEGNALTAIVDANPSNGTLTLNADGSFTYIHDGSETTSDSFTYHANDGTIDGNVVTVSITITAVNDAPVAVADSYSTSEGGTLTVGEITGVLINDTDAENNTLTSIEVTGPTNGSLTLNADGSFTYIHNGGETTSDSFTYKVNDGTVDGNTVTVTIAITPVNDAPVAVADGYSVAEGATLTINVATGLLANDTDAEVDVLISILVTNPTNGTLTLNADGSFTYVHDGSETTSDSFTYKVNDGTVDGNTVTVSLTISPVNDAPVAVADEYDVAVGGSLTINNVLGVLKNDTDAENDALTAMLVAGPSHGTLTFNTDGSFTYTHDNSVTYTDTYTYRADDGQLQSSPVTVTINITGVNNKPVAVAESYSVNEGGTLSINAPGLLSNDTDADGDAITAVLVSDVSHGTLTLNADGSFTYINNGGEAVSDQFSYRAFDGKQNGNVVDAVITINGINDAPVAVADAYTVAEGGSITVDAPGLLGNDSDAENDALTAIVVANPTNGTLTFNADGSFTYTHNGSETTSDSFSYKVSDGNLESNVVAVNVTVTPINDLPVVNTNTYIVAEGGSLSIDALGVLGNDTDAEGDALTAILVDNPLHGTLTFNADGSFVYNHDGSETLSDSFTYLVDDGKGNSLPVTVTININAVNDAPVAANDNYTIAEGGTLTVNIPGVLGNDSDAEGDALTIVLVAAPVNGTLTLNADGSFTYIHNGSETLSDSFTYNVNDGTVDGNTATVAISITPVNDAPVGTADTYDVAMGATITIGASNGVLKNDTDAEGDALTAVLVAAPSHGTLTLNADGSFTYIHDNTVVYTDVFTYKAADGNDQSSVVTVTLNITGLNKKPVAVADGYNVNEGATLTVAASGVLANDTDADSDALTSILVTTTSHGTLTLTADGSFTYVHDGGETTSDSFDYQVFDGKQNGNTVTVTIQVNAVNDAPVAVADSYLVDEGASLVVGAPGVVGNDSDAENNALTVVLVDSPSNGTITLNADGTFTYTHNGGETSTDSFSYKLSDGTSESNVVVVALGVNPVNDAPVTTNANSSAKTNTTLNGTLAGNVTDAEGDALTFDTTPVSGPSNGVLTMNTDGTYTYVPYTDFVGTDIIVVRVCDAQGACTTLTLTIVEVNGNTAPVVSNSNLTVAEDGTANDNLTAFVSDPDGDALTINVVPVTAPQHGVLTINADGTYTYTPNANYHGADSFVFEVCDSNGACAQGTVSINVTSVNDAPVVVGSSQAVLEDEAASGNLLVNATDADGDALSVNTIPVALPLHGTLVINPDGSYVYTPNADYVGSDSFVFEVCDGNGACSQATVTITVNAVNDAPVIGSINQTVLEDESVTGNLLATITDAEGDALVVNTTPVVAPQHGTLVINPDGSYTYTPAAEFNGTDSFVFEVCDNKGACTQAIVSITVLGVNDTPVAVNDTLSVGQGQAVDIEVLLNDSGLGDGGLVVSIASQPQHGTATVNGNGTLTYIPANGFNGVDFITYRVCDGNGDCAEAVVTINATGEVLIIPHGFSPNGDGTNDFFVIPDIGKFTKVGIEILNRWGNTVYKQTKYENDWDGLANVGFTVGKELPAGTYFYIIKVDDIDKAYTGYVYLNR